MPDVQDKLHNDSVRETDHAGGDSLPESMESNVWALLDLLPPGWQRQDNQGSFILLPTTWKPLWMRKAMTAK